MALPMSSTPVYNLEIPSTGKQITFRPFLIKEEKALLIAQQSESAKVMMDTLKKVIADCVREKDVDVNQLATFDLEYIFAQLRARSVGEVVDLIVKCDTCEDEKAAVNVKIDISSITVYRSPGHSNKIELFDGVGVVMKYPSMELVDKLSDAADNIDTLFDIVIQSIDYIYTAEEIFYSKDQTQQDILDFLNNLTSDQFEKIQKFFESMPKLKKDIEYTCPVCNTHHKKVLEGIGSFF